MTLHVLFAATDKRWAQYRHVLPQALAAKGLEAEVSTGFSPEETDYIVYAPNGPVQDFRPYKRAKAVLNLWAGVETLTGNETLTQPLTRMVDSGLEEGMVQYVAAHVLRHHLDTDRWVKRTAPDWTQPLPLLTRERTVAILGLGELGRACGAALAGLGFRVLGWSRRPREIEGIACHSGEAGLEAVLAQAEILVLLLPSTPQTENLLDARRLALMPPGAVIVNPGRGPLIDDAALLAALDSGQIGHATLDVFRVEPLPDDHPYWTHPRVTVTPHIASETRADTASEVIAENIRRAEAGEPLLYLVDRKAGY